MYIVTERPSVLDVPHLRLSELATLTAWGDLYCMEVAIRAADTVLSGEMAFIGYGDGNATWSVYWMAGRLWLAHLPDPSAESPEGWTVAIGSVEEAMARITATLDKEVCAA